VHFVYSGARYQDKELTPTAIPEAEIDLFTQQVESEPRYGHPMQVVELYRSCGLDVLPGAFNQAVIEPIVTAVQQQTPLSAIRIGDGEAAFLTHGAYEGTPCLDRFVIAKTMGMMSDSFVLTDSSATVLRDLFADAVNEATIIGVRGMGIGWPSTAKASGIDHLISRLRGDPRGAVGGWRAIDFMVRLARRGSLTHKTVASAHLYFAVLENLPILCQHANTVICVTDKPQVVTILKSRFCDVDFQLIDLRKSREARSRRSVTPDFLQEVGDTLSEDLRGCLVLVGAGVWAEIYCTWIRRRGGVGVDIGSAFDLMAGEISRPVHSLLLRRLQEVGVDVQSVLRDWKGSGFQPRRP